MRKTSPLMKACDIVLEFVAIALVGILATTWGGQVFAAESLRHPMDPLTAREYAAVITALKKDNYVDNSSRYSLITLDDPAKAKWPRKNNFTFLTEPTCSSKLAKSCDL